MEMSMNKKGLIFALDAALAVTIVVIMVINSTYYFSTSSRSSLSHIQLVRLGGDIVALFEQTDQFDAIVWNASKKFPPVNVYEIPSSLLNLSLYLPGNYEMWVSVSDTKETVMSLTPPYKDCFDTAATAVVQGVLLERDIIGLLQVNITVGVAVNGAKNARVNGVLKVIPGVSKSGLYTIGLFNFKKGANTVQFTSGALDPDVCVEWFRILGSEAYAGSTNENIQFPSDRFIGAGERFVAVKKQVLGVSNPMEGTHIVRYRVWLKGG